MEELKFFGEKDRMLCDRRGRFRLCEGACFSLQIVAVVALSRWGPEGTRLYSALYPISLLLLLDSSTLITPDRRLSTGGERHSLTTRLQAARPGPGYQGPPAHIMLLPLPLLCVLVYLRHCVAQSLDDLPQCGVRTCPPAACRRGIDCSSKHAS